MISRGSRSESRGARRGEIRHAKTVSGGDPGIGERDGGLCEIRRHRRCVRLSSKHDSGRTGTAHLQWSRPLVQQENAWWIRISGDETAIARSTSAVGPSDEVAVFLLFRIREIGRCIRSGHWRGDIKGYFLMNSMIFAFDFGGESSGVFRGRYTPRYRRLRQSVSRARGGRPHASYGRLGDAASRRIREAGKDGRGAMLSAGIWNADREASTTCGSVAAPRPGRQPKGNGSKPPRLPSQRPKGARQTTSVGFPASGTEEERHSSSSPGVRASVIDWRILRGRRPTGLAGGGHRRSAKRRILLIRGGFAKRTIGQPPSAGTS